MQKKRKTSRSKPKKRRLVFELIPDGKSRLLMPQVAQSRQNWIGVVQGEIGNFVDEFELKADNKVLLGEFLTGISESLPEILDDSCTGCRVKVYAKI